MAAADKGWVVWIIMVGLLSAGAGSTAAGLGNEPAPAEAVAGATDAAASAANDDERPVFEGALEVEGRPIQEGSSVTRHGVLVTTVSERQIEDLDAQDPASALRRLPGVVVSRYNLVGAFGGGDGGAVFIRGHGSGRPGAEILTLVDGIPRFVGVWTHPLLDILSLDPAARVDVYRSAQPVLLGNMAFGAVNMVTEPWSRPGVGGRMVGSFGEHDTMVGRLEAGARSDLLDWRLQASHRSSDGHRPDAGGQVQAASGRVGVRLAEGWDATLQLHLTEGRVDDPGRVDRPPTPITPTYDTDSDFWLATVSHRHGSWTGSVKLYVDHLEADWLQWDAAAGESFRSLTTGENWGVRWRETLVPWAGAELVVGLDHDRYGGRFVERRPDGDRLATDLQLFNTAPYVMLSHTFGGAVTVTPSVGVRYNSSGDFGDEWGGQAGLRMGFGRHVLYANVAHAFNLPGVWAAVQYGGWGRGEQWKDLRAEELDHLEVGWLAALSPSVRLDLSLFHDDVSDALRFVPPPPPPPLFANVGEYTSRGVEASLELTPGAGLTVFLGGTWSDPEPSDVPNLPEVTAVAGLAWDAGAGCRLNLDGQYVASRSVLNPRFAPGQTEVDAYLLVNGRATAPVPRRLGLDGELFLAAENLGDEGYELRPGYPMPGRTFSAGFDLRF